MSQPQSSSNDSFNRKYKVLSKIGEGSYSEVLKCKNRENGSTYACKRLKHNYKSCTQVDEIPEILTLRKLEKHPNILSLVELIFDTTLGTVSLIFELMDMNMYELIKDRKKLLSEQRVKVLMFQLLRAVRHLHKHGIFHRDLKPENILLKAQNDQLKLGDLGSVRGLYSRPPYTEYISTRWYRSPECLLTSGFYSYKMDIWAVGCVFYEILTLRPLFPGQSEIDQISKIHNVTGEPTLKIIQKLIKSWEDRTTTNMSQSKIKRHNSVKKSLNSIKNKALCELESNTKSIEYHFSDKEFSGQGIEKIVPSHVSTEAKEMLVAMLQYDPDKRPSAHKILHHSYFRELREKALKIRPPGAKTTLDKNNNNVINNNIIQDKSINSSNIKVQVQENKKDKKGTKETTASIIVNKEKKEVANIVIKAKEPTTTTSNVKRKEPNTTSTFNNNNNKTDKTEFNEANQRKIDNFAIELKALKEKCKKLKDYEKFIKPDYVPEQKKRLTDVKMSKSTFKNLPKIESTSTSTKKILDNALYKELRDKVQKSMIEKRKTEVTKAEEERSKGKQQNVRNVLQTIYNRDLIEKAQKNKAYNSIRSSLADKPPQRNRL